MYECIKRLISQGDEESLECLCQLLKTKGKELDDPTVEGSKESMEGYFTQMQKILDKHFNNSKVRLKLQEATNLKREVVAVSVSTDPKVPQSQAGEQPLSPITTAIVDSELLSTTIPQPWEILPDNSSQSDISRVEQQSDSSSVSPTTDNEDKENVDDPVQNETKQSNKLKYSYKGDRWRPVNKEGNKRYDRDFLLQLQCQPSSLAKPQNLPNLDAIKDKKDRFPRMDENNPKTIDQMPPVEVRWPVYNGKGKRGSKGKKKKTEYNKKSNYGGEMDAFLDEGEEVVAVTVSTAPVVPQSQADQWRPVNKERKKQYDRDFLLQLQCAPLSLVKPQKLPNLNIIKDKPHIHRLDILERTPVLSTYQFLPTFARSGVLEVDWLPRKDEKNPKAIKLTQKDAEPETYEEQEDLQSIPFQRRVPHDRDRIKNSAPCKMVTCEDGWTSSTNSSYSLVDPNKLKLTKPSDVDSIKLGPERAMQSSGGDETGGRVGPSKPDKAAAENTEISEVGLMSSLKNKSTCSSVDPNKLNLTKPSDADSIKLGPEKATLSLSGDEIGGSAGPSKPEKAAAQKSKMSEVDLISSTKSKSGNSNDDPNKLKLTKQLSTEPSNAPHDTNRQAVASQTEKYTNSGGMPTLQQQYQSMYGLASNPQNATLVQQRQQMRSNPMAMPGYYTARSSVPQTIPNMGRTPLQTAVNQAGQQPTSHYGQMLPPFSHPMQPDIVNHQFQQMYQQRPFSPPQNIIFPAATGQPVHLNNQWGTPYKNPPQANSSFYQSLPTYTNPISPAQQISQQPAQQTQKKTKAYAIIDPATGRNIFDGSNDDEDSSRSTPEKEIKLESTFCPTKVKPTTSTSIDEIKKNLLDLLQKTDESEKILDWIDANVSECTEPKFIRALVSAVHENAIKDTTSGCELDAAKLKKRISILNRYIDHNENLELQALYAIQSLMNQLNQPKGILRQIFDILYDDYVITEESFLNWEQSIDINEVEGKGVALHSVKSFLARLKENRFW
nr:uncharacterized protein LOC107441322 isoform X2 [Parasteatoda tepidariorum]